MQIKNCLRNVLGGGVVVFTVIASQTFVAKDKLILRVATDERPLFHDDVGISTVSGLKRPIHRPSRRGAVIIPDHPRETYCNPAWEEERGVSRVGMIASTSIPGLAETSYAESKAGLHPFRILPVNLHAMSFTWRPFFLIRITAVKSRIVGFTQTRSVL